MFRAPSFAVPNLAMPEIASQDSNGIEGQEIQLVFSVAQQLSGRHGQMRRPV
jgi:hypothetical protein